MKKIMIFLSFLVLLEYQAYSQQMEQSSLYMYNSLYYNPAYAGTRNTLSASVIIREQWVGLDGSPSSQYFSIHTPIANRKLGIGLHFNNDKIGSRRKNTVYADFAATIKLNQNNDRLNFGLSAGIDNYSFGFSELYALDVNDPIANTNYSKLTPNIGAGIYFYNDKYYAGISVPSIISHTNNVEGISHSINKMHLFITGGYVFNINSTLDLKLASLIRYTHGAPITMEFNSNLLLYKKVWVGAMYRTGEGVGINASVILFDGFTVGYAYDFPLNKLRTHQKGSHEILLQYDFTRYKNKNKIYSPRYF